MAGCVIDSVRARIFFVLLFIPAPAYDAEVAAKNGGGGGGGADVAFTAEEEALLGAIESRMANIEKTVCGGCKDL